MILYGLLLLLLLTFDLITIVHTHIYMWLCVCVCVSDLNRLLHTASSSSSLILRALFLSLELKPLYLFPSFSILSCVLNNIFINHLRFYFYLIYPCDSRPSSCLLISPPQLFQSRRYHHGVVYAPKIGLIFSIVFIRLPFFFHHCQYF